MKEAINQAKKIFLIHANNNNFDSLSTFATLHATAIKNILLKLLQVSENLAIEIEKKKISDGGF